MSGLATSLFWLLLFVGGGIYLAYQRIDLRTSTIAMGVALAAYTIWGDWAWWALPLLWAGFAVMVGANMIEARREKVTKTLLAIYCTMLPSM